MSWLEKFKEDVRLNMAEREAANLADYASHQLGTNMEKVIANMPVEALRQLASYLGFDPLVVYTSAPAKCLSQTPEEEQLVWLDNHRLALMKEISLVGGHSVVNLLRGGQGVPYTTLVYGLAQKLGVVCQPTELVDSIEAKIVAKVWQNITTTMTPEQREKLEREAEEQAKKLGKSIKGELGALGTLGAAQLSGFGVYMLGSTMLGAINTALGLGLGFGAFAGLSQAIAVVIGPVGWTAMGLVAIAKLGAPNYKKLLPVVILISSYRERSGARTQPQPAASGPATTSDERLDWVALEMSNGDKLFADLSEPDKERAKQNFAQRTPEPPTLAATVKQPKLPVAASPVEQAKDKPCKPTTQRIELSPAVPPKRVNELQKKYLNYFRHVAFLEPALIRLCEYDKEVVLRFERKFSVMNEGETEGKHNVPRTDPLVWQQDVGRDLRVYFRHDSYQNRLLVVLVGTKSSQESDYRRLRKGQDNVARKWGTA